MEIDIKCTISCHVHPLAIDIHAQCIFSCYVQPVETEVKLVDLHPLQPVDIDV